MDNANLVLQLWFRFDRFIALSHRAHCSAMGMSFKPEIVPQTVDDVASEFPIT